MTPTICSSLIGFWRHTFGLRAPLRKAFAATLTRVASEMSWSCRYRLSFMAKNCVVTMKPRSPYHWPMPAEAGSALNIPRGCLSNPTARPRSNCPDPTACVAAASALPAVAQPLETLMNCRPVRPSSLTSVSAVPELEPSLPGSIEARLPP